MKMCIAVFRSKTETYKFIDYMRANNIECAAVTTPKEAHVGCGISAKFPYRNLNIAYKIVNSGAFTSFKNFFVIEKQNGRSSTVRI